jgi:hypothetical protein
VPGWDAPPWAAVRPTNAKAILAVSLLSVAPAAIVFGVLARREIRRTGEAGWGLATWGMGIGIGLTALWVLYALLGLLYVGVLVGLAAHAASTGYAP